MKAFRYVAINPQGRRLSGTGYAPNQDALRDNLLDTRLQPLSIRPTLLQLRGSQFLTETVGARIAKDLARLLSRGISLNQALGWVIDREVPAVSAMMRGVRDRLSAGATLSSALAALSGPSSRFLAAMALAGETSGKQAEVLASAAATLQTSAALKQKLLTLSLYPLLVIAVAFLSIGIYAFSVLPSLEPAFEGLGDAVPPQTRAVLIFGAVVRVLLPVLVLGGLGFALLFAASHAFRARLNETLSKLAMRPTASPARDAVFAGLSGRLDVMVGSGVPLPAAWRLAREPIGMDWLKASLQAQDSGLAEGASLSDALSRTPLCSPDLIHFVTLGEQTGDLAKALSEASAFLGGRAQESIERALSIITPVVILSVGGLVGGITLMVFQGLLAIGDTVA
jgi:general secretion pathway protein F